MASFDSSPLEADRMAQGAYDGVERGAWRLDYGLRDTTRTTSPREASTVRAQTAPDKINFLTRIGKSHFQTLAVVVSGVSKCWNIC